MWSEMLREIYEPRLIDLFSAFSVELGSYGDITAHTNSGSLIPGNGNAYRYLTDFNMGTDSAVPVNLNAYRRRGIMLPVGFAANISMIRLQTLGSEPLVLDELRSDYIGDVKVSVYAGVLGLNWKETTYRWRFVRSGTQDKFSPIDVHDLTLRFRLDDLHDSLSCYDPADQYPPGYPRLLCAELRGTLRNPICGVFNALHLKFKSHYPDGSDTTAHFGSGRPVLTVY